MSESKKDSYRNGTDFEIDVAHIYRMLGAKVEHNVALAGNQIDLVVYEVTKTGNTIRTAVECKAYSRPVGVHIVNSFVALAILLKTRGLIDKAVLISSGGFTTEARESGKASGVDLLELDDLRALVGEETLMIDSINIVQKPWEKLELPTGFVLLETRQKKRVFVVMPFAPEYDDIYILGIRETAEKLDLVSERADEIENIESVIEMIRDKIESCDAIIADTTAKNPNVFYEIGYAHGVRKPVVLICRENESIPFDLQNINFIRYTSIIDLRDKLGRRLKSILL